MARKAKSLDALLNQVNALYPTRSKSSDGWIGDAAHAARKSDHNPNSAGVVQAIDITHDPARGFDSYKFADMLVRNKDPRVKSIISNSRICSTPESIRVNGYTGPAWVWRGYDGSNSHSQHVHISVNDAPALYDNASTWNLGVAWPKPAGPSPKNTFDESLQRLLVHEGGYTDHPDDPGGATNFGITLTDYKKYVHPSGTAANLRVMSVITAKEIYRKKYWNAMNCDALPAGVDYAVFDYGVNSGIGRAPKVLQRIVGVTDDGDIGSITLAAVRVRDPKELITAVCDERMTYLRALPHWPTFGKGWGRRVTEVRAAALAMANAAPTVEPAPPIIAPPSSATLSWWDRIRAFWLGG